MTPFHILESLNSMKGNMQNTVVLLVVAFKGICSTGYYAIKYNIA